MGVMECRRRLLMQAVKSGGVLPDEYQEVEYIESSGTNQSATDATYIDTGIIPNGNMRVRIEGITSSLSTSSAGFIFGSRMGSGLQRFWFITWSGYYCFGLGSNQNTRISLANSSERFVMDFNYNETHDIKVNDVIVANNTVVNSYTYSMYLFGINDRNSLNYQYVPNLRIMRFKVFESYEDTNPIMNLVPCYRKSDSEPGMYDTVSQTFYTNAGTGTFIIPT